MYDIRALQQVADTTAIGKHMLPKPVAVEMAWPQQMKSNSTFCGPRQVMSIVLLPGVNTLSLHRNNMETL